MTGKTRRSFLRTCCAGAAVGTLGGIGTVRSASADDDDAFVVEQARYISKYAAEGEWAFGELTPLFDPPSDEELMGYFEESFTPSIASVLPGFVGQATELVEMLSWYDAVGQGSGFRQVSDSGLDWGFDAGPPDTGGSGQAMYAARNEIDDVADAFADVDQRAQACIDDPSTANVDQLIEEMDTLIDTLDDCDRVTDWTKIEPTRYDGNANSDEAQTAAEKVRDNAQAVLDVAAEFETRVADQRAAIRDGEYQPFPSAVVVYDRSVDKFRSNVPLFGTFTGDSYNLRTENADGERLSVRWLDTDSSGAVADYELEKRDSADADIVLSESTLTDIVDADDSMAAAVDAYKAGEVEVDANGWGNMAKYEVFPQLINVIDSIL